MLLLKRYQIQFVKQWDIKFMPQQQQQSNPVKPQKIGVIKKSISPALKFKALMPKGMKPVGMDDPYWNTHSDYGVKSKKSSLPKKTKSKPTMKQVQKSVKKTMGY